MKKLGIRLEKDTRQDQDVLHPDFPLLAACYGRNGYIRLARADRKRSSRT